MTFLFLQQYNTIKNKVEYFKITNCTQLKTLTIPSSVTAFYYMAFDGCSKLDTIYYNGVMEQWFNISKTNNWSKDIIANSVVCKNGTVTI